MHGKVFESAAVLQTDLSPGYTATTRPAYQGRRPCLKINAFRRRQWEVQFLELTGDPSQSRVKLSIRPTG